MSFLNGNEHSSARVANFAAGDEFGVDGHPVFSFDPSISAAGESPVNLAT